MIQNDKWVWTRIIHLQGKLRSPITCLGPEAEIVNSSKLVVTSSVGVKGTQY